MSPKIIEYPSRNALAEAVASQLADRLRTLIAERGRATIALPGGSSPAAMLTLLGTKDVPWDDVVVTLTDERWVPPTEARSNQGMLGETLFRGPAASATFVPLYGGTAEPGDSLKSISSGLAQTVLPLDIAVLGMGADMHTASFFPNSVGLQAALADDAPEAVAIRTASAEEPRITLSARVLRDAGERHLLITGQEKRAALDTALKAASAEEAPVRTVLDGATVHYAD